MKLSVNYRATGRSYLVIASNAPSKITHQFVTGFPIAAFNKQLFAEYRSTASSDTNRRKRQSEVCLLIVLEKARYDYLLRSPLRELRYEIT